MRVQILSDLHVDFHKDIGRSFINSLNPEGIDIFVIAGDVCESQHLSKTLDLICDHFKGSRILYVLGNHEYYKSTPDNLRKIVDVAVMKHSNLTWLNRSSIEISGRRFIGCTLWYGIRSNETDQEALYEATYMSDFATIKDFLRWVRNESNLDVEFLRNNVRSGDIVITHLLPSQLSVDHIFKNSSLNRFFVNDVSDVISNKTPYMWIHGHTHIGTRYMLGDTNVICNPFGYLGEISVQRFDDRLIIDV